VNYGPGISEIAHTADEYVPVDKIAQCEDRLRAWLS
jgi:succinyl-diaminopimelate desuccinylase